jgi:hypothetical protein
MSAAGTLSAEARLAEAAIAVVPGWAGRAVSYREVTAPVMSPMHRNVDSLGFVVEVDASSYFLKIAHPDVRAQILTERVFAAAHRAGTLGLAPMPLDCLPAHHAIVFERLDESWHPARIDDIRRPTVMEGAITAKAALHTQPRIGWAWSVFDGIRDVAARVATASSIEPALFNWMIAAADDIEAAFKAAGTDVATCHADGLACNVMVGPNDTVRLIDFDQACDTDPLYDIGILLNEAYAFPEEMAPALEMYEGRVRPATLNRCRLYGIADDLYWAMCSSSTAATTSRPGIEFLKYAQWRLLRCRMALQDADFESMLRAI